MRGDVPCLPKGVQGQVTAAMIPDEPRESWLMSAPIHHRLIGVRSGVRMAYPDIDGVPVDLAKDWRTDRYLRRLEEMLSA